MYKNIGLLLGLCTVGSIFAADPLAHERPAKRRRTGTGGYIFSQEAPMISELVELSEREKETVIRRLNRHSMNVRKVGRNYNAVMNYPLDKVEAPEADDDQCEFTQEELTTSLKEFEGYLGKQQDAQQRYVSMNRGLEGIQQILLGAEDDKQESIVASCESHIEQLQGAEQEKGISELLKAATYLNIVCLKEVCESHPALPYTFKTKRDQEFCISKETIVRFSGLIRDCVQSFELRRVKGHLQKFESVDTPFTMSFESDIVKPKALGALLPVLEQAGGVLIEKPVSKKGSYRQLADLIIERNVDIDADLINFFDLDERIKQAIACAVINQMDKKGLTCEAICAALSNDLSLQNMLYYIAQQYYLIKGTVPEVFTEYTKGIGLTVRDLLVYEKARPTTANILNLDESYIRDLEGIADITGVNQVLQLYLHNNQLQTIKELKNMPHLEYLSCTNNKLETLEELKNMPHLEYLLCKNNKLETLGELNNLSNLSVLDLGNNQLKTIGRLNLPSLIVLRLENNKLETLEELNNLRNLEELHLEGNQLRTIEGLNDLPHLVELNLEGNQLESIEGLNDLLNLEDLNLSDNQLESIEGLNLLNLEGLDLSHNPLQSIEGLNNLPNLRVLTLNKDQLPLIEELDLPGLNVHVRE